MTVKTLEREQFVAEFGEVFDGVFLPKETLPRFWAPPFREPTWQIVATWGPQELDSSVYRALVAAAGAVGDGEVVLTDAEAPPRHRHAVVFSLATGRLSDAYKSGPFGVDAALFGRSGAWGVYFEWDADIAYVAGSAEFMSVFLEEAGGVDALKQRLNEVVDETEDHLQLRFISEVLEELGWDREILGEKHP